MGVQTQGTLTGLLYRHPKGLQWNLFAVYNASTIVLFAAGGSLAGLPVD